jgi:hypothetical protein
MKLSDLSPEVLERIKSVRWDRIIEKHEGQEDWDSVLRYYERRVNNSAELIRISVSNLGSIKSTEN